MKILLAIFIIGFGFVSLVNSKGTPYKIEYDYAGHGDDWYGQPANDKPYLDYYSETAITTQLGDDFCVNYEPTLVHYAQGSALLRTQEKRTAYSFKYNSTSDCTTSTPPPPKPDLIFADGFEN